jgi:PqqD family protein of HPr-rel-A system
MKLRANIALSESGFLFDPRTGDSYSLNPTARLIVERLRDGTGEEAIRDAVLGAYRTDEATFDKDFGDFLAELRRHHLLQDEPEEA